MQYFVTLRKSDKTGQSNKKRVISVELAEGKYDYTIMAVGYEPVQGELVVDKNVMHRDYIAMKKTTAKANEGIA